MVNELSEEMNETYSGQGFKEEVELHLVLSGLGLVRFKRVPWIKRIK